MNEFCIIYRPKRSCESIIRQTAEINRQVTALQAYSQSLCPSDKQLALNMMYVGCEGLSFQLYRKRFLMFLFRLVDHFFIVDVIPSIHTIEFARFNNTLPLVAEDELPNIITSGHPYLYATPEVNSGLQLRE